MLGINRIVRFFRGLEQDEKPREIKLNNRTKLGTKVNELEAETIAYLINVKLGLTSTAAEYLAGYIGSEEDIIKFNYEIVIHAVDKLERVFLK